MSEQASELERTLGRLRLGDEHAALVQVARGLASTLDHGGCAECGSPSQNAALWREYRAAVASLTEVDVGSDDDEADEFTSAVSAPVRNGKDA